MTFLNFTGRNPADGVHHLEHAVGGSEEAALLMGVPVGRTKVVVYGTSAAIAGMAGRYMSMANGPMAIMADTKVRK